MTAGARVISQRYKIPGLDHLRCLDGGARLPGRAGRTDPFGWISGIDELAKARADEDRQDEEYFPDQGPAFLYSHGL